jgi:hypothetical protein
MSSVVIAGDTSGTVTLAAPAVSGTTTLTLPTTSGTIVTTSGSQTIEFADGSASTPSITNSGDTNTGMFFPAADTIAFAEGGTESMRIDSSGNVGIGTTGGAAGLTVYKYGSTWTGAGASTYPYPAGNVFLQTGGIASQDNWIGITGNYNTSTGSANILLQANLQDTSNQAGNYIGSEATAIGQAALTFGRMIGGATVGGNAAKSEAMRIDSSGKVMFNTSSVLNAGYMSLLFDGSAINGFTIKNSSATFGPYLYFVNSAGNVAGYVIQNGTTTVSYTTSSDYRLKENIVPMTGALDKVIQLKPVTYTWKADGSNGQGFIAHELQEVVPDAVTGEKDAVETYTDKDGIEQTRIKPQGVDTSFLVATLTAAIQEQQAIIETLKADIAELKAKVK